MYIFKLLEGNIQFSTVCFPFKVEKAYEIPTALKILPIEALNHVQKPFQTSELITGDVSEYRLMLLPKLLCDFLFSRHFKPVIFFIPVFIYFRKLFTGNPPKCRMNYLMCFSEAAVSFNAAHKLGNDLPQPVYFEADSGKYLFP